MISTQSYGGFAMQHVARYLLQWYNYVLARVERIVTWSWVLQYINAVKIPAPTFP